MTTIDTTQPDHTIDVLGLRCPIARAVLDARDADHLAEFVGRCVGVALRENPVPQVSLCVALNEGLDVLDGMFEEEVGGGMTHLVLVLDVVGPWPPVPLDEPFGWDALLVRP